MQLDLKVVLMDAATQGAEVVLHLVLEAKQFEDGLVCRPCSVEHQSVYYL